MHGSTKLKKQDAVALAAKLHPYGPVVADALSLAAHVHDGIFRKETRAGVEYRDPYIAHPMRNALRAARFMKVHYPAQRVADVMISCLLHDTVEDGPERVCAFYSSNQSSADAALDLVRQNYGHAVFDAVRRVTNPPMEGMSREQKQLAYLDHLLLTVIPSQDAYLTKAMDLIDNAGSLKHMDPCPKRTALSRKYVEPLRRMAECSEVVQSEEVRQALAQRLWQVHREVITMSA